MLNRLTLMFVLLSIVGNMAMADELPTSEVDNIKRLMEITESDSIGNQIVSEIFRIMAASRPEIPDRALAIMERELVALFSEKVSAPGGMKDQLIPIYKKYFSDQEIRELIAFYQSPIGEKIILVMPRVVNESMKAGQRWAESLGPEIDERVMSALKREGLLKKE